MAGLDPATHVLTLRRMKDVDACTIGLCPGWAKPDPSAGHGDECSRMMS